MRRIDGESSTVSISLAMLYLSRASELGKSLLDSCSNPSDAAPDRITQLPRINIPACLARN
jgi:hypothetical protein